MMTVSMYPLVLELPFCPPEKIARHLHHEPWFMWLDSACQMENWGRFSFIMTQPFQVLRAWGDRIEVNDRCVVGSPFAVLQQEMQRFQWPEPLASAVPFQGGVVGYWGYELAEHLEDLPEWVDEGRHRPDLALGFYDVVLAFDHVDQVLWLFSSGFPEFDPAKRYVRAHERAAYWSGRIEQVCRAVNQPSDETLGSLSSVASRVSQATYEQSVQQVIDYILAGDIFQANISQEFSAQLSSDASHFAWYQRLRRDNPAPFAGYLSCGGMVIASSSPERFVSQTSSGRLQACPIKGTTYRGHDPRADARLQQALCNSAKDRAENIMIVDLMRNDLSKVALAGSVVVESLCQPIAFAHVHHLVSTITAQCLPDKDAVEVLMALFPCGSVTGAPKIRAMEIIRELEPHRRGPYCGCFGYLSFHQTFDLAVTIRTLVIEGTDLRFYVGGAVVADSDPLAEYQETLLKSRGLVTL